MELSGLLSDHQAQCGTGPPLPALPEQVWGDCVEGGDCDESHMLYLCKRALLLLLRWLVSCELGRRDGV